MGPFLYVRAGIEMRVLVIGATGIRFSKCLQIGCSYIRTRFQRAIRGAESSLDIHVKRCLVIQQTLRKSKYPPQDY